MNFLFTELKGFCPEFVGLEFKSQHSHLLLKRYVYSRSRLSRSRNFSNLYRQLAH